MTDHAAVPIHALAELRERRRRVTISFAALAALDEAGGRRARVRYRAHPLYRELLHLHKAALIWRATTDAHVSSIDTATPPAGPSPVMLTTDQAARLVGITPHGIRDAIRTGRLPGIKAAGRWWVPADAAADYATGRTMGAG